MSDSRWLSDFLLSNPFWLFLGVVAGALIQTILHWLQRHRHASLALKVLQIEICYNLEKADKYILEMERQKELIVSKELPTDKVFFPMTEFNYSAMGPINNTGFLHILLGADRLGSVLGFNGHFNNQSGELLYAALKQSEAAGKSVQFLHDEIARAKELRRQLAPISNAKKVPFRLSIKTPVGSKRS